MPQNDFLFRGELSELDPDIAELIRHETARQERNIILIPSESTIPEAVREALMSPFTNLYAEGYPLDETRAMTQQQILDYNARLPEYRRLADKRYYKGTEYADVVEALARRRAAELFATPQYPAEKLFVNVQPLSGAPANSAIFSELINVGDPIMGLDLLQGGHLTHGSPVARSGKQYQAFSYGVDSETERLDYDQIRTLALAHRPRIIIAGYTSYPFAPDWAAFKSIADEVGAYLMADVSHVAGLIIAGIFPTPVGIADVISFTSHKTLAGPRGAVIITHRSDVAGKVDRAVFPGEQGGPHVNQMAALAVSLRLANTEQFNELQRQTAVNAVRLAQKLESRGLRIPYGGTESHMLLVDCKSVVGTDGTTLSGDQAARILDLAGITCNRNTIPGDPSALRATGIRIGTPWITQRGFKEAEIDRLGDIIADVLTACVPFSYTGRRRAEPRAKLPFAVLEAAKIAVRELTSQVGIDTDSGGDEYPHVSYPDETDTAAYTLSIRDIGHTDPAAFLDVVLTSDVYTLSPGQSQPTALLNPDGSLLAKGVLQRTGNGGWLLHVENGRLVANWLRAVSDGFVLIDDTDPYAKAPGPVDVQLLSKTSAPTTGDVSAFSNKAYAIGLNGAAYVPSADPLPAFSWAEPQAAELKRTPIHPLHLGLNAKMAPFAGYEMPLWYSTVSEEHAAVRKNAGVFDVTHMGVFDARGTGAEAFLDLVATNEVRGLAVGDSHYTYFLDLDGVPLDDLMIYRLAQDHFLIVVNASNNDKNWAWLNAVKNGEVQIDAAHPSRRFTGGSTFELRDLRSPVNGADCRLDIALQGPNSKNILLTMTDDAGKTAINKLQWANIARVKLKGMDIIISRTGYTGERIAYELFVHPNDALELFRDLIDAGAAPAGLAARDSLRTEAGLPLYGHELGVILDGAYTLNPADAGFGNYAKLWKSFFVGKAAFITHEAERDAEISRFRLTSKGSRPPHPGDPIVDARGRVVGVVTSCSLDSEGYQLGQALLKEDIRAEGTTLAVFCSAARTRQDKPLSTLGLGDRAPVPEPIVVLSRFPKK
ncbi:MAG: serine hydroxymethyltransferase [Anaerolineae bacterium]|nr:serine hydroxymethyltransferase [Anaerolineae bacterium]